MNKAQKQKVREKFRQWAFFEKDKEVALTGKQAKNVENYLISKLEEQEWELVGRIEGFYTESAKANVELKDFPEYCRGWDTALALLLNSITKE